MGNKVRPGLKKKKKKKELGSGAYSCNPSYSVGGDQED
jgi:hypothetical protein